MHSLPAGDRVLHAAESLVGVYLAAVCMWELFLGRCFSMVGRAVF